MESIMITELERLHQLFTQGALSQTEFATAKASLLKGPSADLLKLDELRDELNRLQRDWDEERRKYHPYPNPESAKGPIRIFNGFAVCGGVVTIGAIVMAACLRNAGGLFFACGSVFLTGIFHIAGKWLSRLMSKFSDDQQIYQTRRAELESQIAALRNQLRGEANGN